MVGLDNSVSNNHIYTFEHCSIGKNFIVATSGRDMDITSNPASPADNVNEYHNRDIALFNKDLSLYKNFALRMSSSWYPSNPGNANGLYDRALDMQSFLYTSGSDEYVLAIYWDHHSGYDFIGGVIFNPSI